MWKRTGPSMRRGFTLIEVLVVVAIIGLLAAILLPSLTNARDQSKELLCATNLSNFSRGFFCYAAANKDLLCSGSFDPGQQINPTIPTIDGRDGPVDKVGWVADLVNSKTAFPAKMLCPTNPAKINQKLGTGSSAGAYVAVQAQKLIARGYNTNYTQSWYMARSEVSNPTEANMKKIKGKLGPLKTTRMIKVAPGRVPLLGDSTLESSDMLQGQITCRTMSNGPYSGPYDNQDYSDFGPQHGYGQLVDVQTGNLRTPTQRIRANVLMADGHIEKFLDRKRDGRFLYTQDASNMLVQDDLDLARVFDGVLTLGRRSRDAWNLQ